MTNRVYWGAFESIEDVNREFANTFPQEPYAEMLFAVYNQGGYDGDAFVLFRQNGILYEVNASHCSCYGLEGQWRPEETTAKSLLLTWEKGSKFRYSIADSGIEARGHLQELFQKLADEEEAAKPKEPDHKAVLEELEEVLHSGLDVDSLIMEPVALMCRATLIEIDNLKAKHTKKVV